MKIKSHMQIGPNGPDDPREKAFAADVLGAFVEKTPHIQDWKPKWECAARKSVLPEPADCNWPFCGCDPYADKVMDAIAESGLKIVKDTEMQAAIAAWLECPKERRPSPEALGKRIAEIAAKELT